MNILNTNFFCLYNSTQQSRAVGSEAAGAVWAASLLKVREAWPLILPVHTDVHRPMIGLHISAFGAENLLTAACPSLPDR